MFFRVLAVIQAHHLLRQYNNKNCVFIKAPSISLDDNIALSEIIFFLFRRYSYDIIYLKVQKEKIYLNKRFYTNLIKAIFKNLIYGLIELTSITVLILK